VLTWLAETCPEGSFEMRPGLVHGAMTLTSTSIEANYVHEREMVVELVFYEACIQAIGVCPRSYERTLLRWEVETETECRGYIDISANVGHDGGPVNVEGNRVTYDFDDTLSGEFCVEGDYLYLNTLHSADFPEHGYYYILKRGP
jgi:hypothetical protein